ncbi:MAG TPA: hypothetical protein V6D15_11380 [Oculatellaceae cyanobacterium]
MTEPEAAEGLVCDTSVSEYALRAGFANNSRQSPQTWKKDAAKGMATGLENQGTGNCKGSIPSSSVFHPPEAEKRGTVLITRQ